MISIKKTIELTKEMLMVQKLNIDLISELTEILGVALVQHMNANKMKMKDLTFDNPSREHFLQSKFDSLDTMRLYLVGACDEIEPTIHGLNELGELLSTTRNRLIMENVEDSESKKEMIIKIIDGNHKIAKVQGTILNVADIVPVFQGILNCLCKEQKSNVKYNIVEE